MPSMTAPPFEELLPQVPTGQDWISVNLGVSGDRVYCRSDGSAYAKLASGVNAVLLDAERRRVRWLAETGVGAPRVLDWVMSDDGACLVTAAIPGIPASHLSSSDLLTAWPSIMRQLMAIHALPVDSCPFDRGLSRMFARAEDVVARGAVNPDFLTPEDQATEPALLLDRLRPELGRRLEQEKDDRVVCHGDACMPNLIVDPSTLRCVGVTDLGRLGTADRYADLALVLANASESWSSPAEAQGARRLLFDILAVSPDQERLDFYLHLDPLTWG
jgi:streptomycin 3"-kinase